MPTTSNNEALADIHRLPWLPTPENVNALPDGVRQYVHDLETRCDHSGELRELIIARELLTREALGRVVEGMRGLPIHESVTGLGGCRYSIQTIDRAAVLALLPTPGATDG